MWMFKHEFDHIMHNRGFMYWDRYYMWWELASTAFDNDALWWDGASGKPWSSRRMAVHVDCNAFRHLLFEIQRYGKPNRNIMQPILDMEFHKVYPDIFYLR